MYGVILEIGNSTENVTSGWKSEIDIQAYSLQLKLNEKGLYFNDQLKKVKTIHNFTTFSATERNHVLKPHKAKKSSKFQWC